MSATNPMLVIEQAVHRTRANALQQLGIGALGAVLMTIGWGLGTFVIVMISLNAVFMFIVGRRLVRLRRKGPAMQALLDDPTQVKEIAAWPRKLPPNRMPVLLDIFTHSGATCSLLLEARNPQATANLLGALHSRSPDALLSIPKLPVARVASD